MLEEIALKYYAQGYNCAETIVLCAKEAYHLDIDESAVRMFAAYGGGIQCGDVCGCLLGAAGVLSALYVTDKAHDTKEIKGYTQLLVREFEKETGSRKCMEIKPKFYSKEFKCRNTVVHGARALENTIKMIQEKRTQD